MRLPEESDVSIDELDMGGLQHSSSLNEIASALNKAQSGLRNPQKTATGYGYKYAPLDNILPQIREQFAKNGLSFIQHPFTPMDGRLGIETMILHISGQWIKGTYSVKGSMQKGMNQYQSAGAAFTYFRRYAAEAMCCVAASADIDAQDRPQEVDKPLPKKANNLKDEAKKGAKALSKAHEELPLEVRKGISKKEMNALKQVAQEVERQRVSQ